MAKLELEIEGYSNALDEMLINGKRPKFVVEGLLRKCAVETESDNVEIVVYRTHHYVGKHWFWWSLLFYFVSVFGIFDVRFDKKFHVVDFRVNVDLKKTNNLKLKVPNFEDGGKVFEIEEGKDVNVLNNCQFLDKDAKKRHNKMKKIKFAISFVTILATILIVTLI